MTYLCERHLLHVVIGQAFDQQAEGQLARLDCGGKVFDQIDGAPGDWGSDSELLRALGFLMRFV